MLNRACGRLELLLYDKERRVVQAIGSWLILGAILCSSTALTASEAEEEELSTRGPQRGLDGLGECGRSCLL